ncbi:MAG: hypothetical protein J5I93_04100 [Pirellulaceae bacterium]|nr:hypothetical protein [Pirellulaceae bacterium]
MTLERSQIKLFANCRLPNRWQMVVSPEVDGELGRFGQWLGLTRIQRHPAHYHSAGDGRLDQGRSLVALLWNQFVARPLTDNERWERQRSISRGVSYGDEAWVATTVQRLGLESDVPRSRAARKIAQSPKKVPDTFSLTARLPI